MATDPWLLPLTAPETPLSMIPTQSPPMCSLLPPTNVVYPKHNCLSLSLIILYQLWKNVELKNIKTTTRHISLKNKRTEWDSHLLIPHSLFSALPPSILTTGPRGVCYCDSHLQMRRERFREARPPCLGCLRKWPTQDLPPTPQLWNLPGNYLTQWVNGGGGIWTQLWETPKPTLKGTDPASQKNGN